MTPVGSRPRNVPSPSKEAKHKFQTYKKYHGLWKSLSTDPAVVREYQLLLKYTQKHCEKTVDVGQEEKQKEEFPALGSSSNSINSTGDTDHVHGEEEEEDEDEGDDDEEGEVDDGDEKFYEGELEDTSSEFINDENETAKDEITNNVVSANDDRKELISTTPNFLSAIAATNSNQSRSQIFKILPSSCCNIIGCDNNCAEPILEVIEDEDQHEIKDSDSVGNGEVGDTIVDAQTRQYEFIDDEEEIEKENEEEMLGVENDNESMAIHNARAVTNSKKSFSPRSRNSSNDDESSFNANTAQGSDEEDADLSISNDISQSYSKSVSSKLLSSSSSKSSSSSSSGGPSVITFDLSHLSIHIAPENSVCNEMDSSNSNSNSNVSALDENGTVGTILNETLIENELSPSTSLLQNASSALLEGTINNSHDGNANFNDENVDEVNDAEFKNEAMGRESFPTGDENEETFVKEAVLSTSSLSSSSLQPNHLSFHGGFVKEIEDMSKSINSPSDRDRDGEKCEDIKRAQEDDDDDEEQEEKSFEESTLSYNDGSYASSSSSGGSTVVRFELDVSLFTDQPKGKDEVNEEYSNRNDTDDDDEKHGNKESEEEEEDRDHQSLVSLSSEEAEWTENEDQLSTGSVSSENDEPSYDVVILSTDESVEEDSYEEDDSFELGTRESMDSNFSNEESKSSEFNEEQSDNNEFDHEEESVDSGYGNDDENSVSIIESYEGVTNEEDIVSMFHDNTIIEIGPKSTDRISPPREKQVIARARPSQLKSKSVFKFQFQREQLTMSTFNHFNNIVFDNALKHVEVSWSKRLTTTAGITRLKKRKTADDVVFSASIELSTKLIDKEERLRATLMHEMCHAAAWLVDNVHRPPHGKVFKKWANLAMRKINGLLVSTTHDYVTNTYKFAWSCTNEACDFIIQRHSRSIDVTRHCCGKCNSKIMEIEVPVDGSTTYVKKQKRKATGFSLFVQQQSKSVRASLSASRGPHHKVSQKDVMIECSRLWKELKAEGKA